MTYRSLLACVALGLLLTLLSTAAPRTVAMTYPDIMGCEQSCEVAAAGFPVAFIVDYPGLSPVGSADLAGALLGLDRTLWDRAAVAYVFWTAVSAGLLRAVAAQRRLSSSP